MVREHLDWRKLVSVVNYQQCRPGRRLSASLAVNNIGQNTRFIGAHKDKIALHQSFERIQMKLKLILKKKYRNPESTCLHSKSKGKSQPEPIIAKVRLNHHCKVMCNTFISIIWKRTMSVWRLKNFIFLITKKLCLPRKRVISEVVLD